MNISLKDNHTLTPQRIVEELNRHVVGHKEAKKQLAVAYRNKWRRSQADPKLQKEIIPTNILIIGPTGTGKTECARRLANVSNSPFFKAEAPQFTEVGYVGRDVESMVRGLADNASHIVRSEKRETVRGKALENVEEIILNTLIPKAVPRNAVSRQTTSLLEQDNNPEGDLNHDTRKKFREKLRSGELDQYKIEVRIQSSHNPIKSMGFLGGALDDATMMNLENVFGKMMNKEAKKKRVTVEEARKLLLEVEMDNLLDMDTIREETVQRTQNEGIIFIDEIDKIVGSGQKTSGPNVSREGVQRDLLPIVEGTTVNTRYGPIQTDHILFIAAGAFHVAQPSDLLPELQGRFPIRVKLDPLSEKDFERILKEPANSLVKQYQALFHAEGVKLIFSDKAIKEIAHLAFKINENMENIGARRLRTVFNHLLSELLFDTPEKIKSGETISVDEALVVKRLVPLLDKTDHNKYIL